MNANEWETAEDLLRAVREASRDFDLGTANLFDPDMIAGLPVAGSARPAVAARLRALQRLHRIGAPFETLDGLLARGVQSAYQVAAMPESAFVRRHGDLFPSEGVARSFHRNATHIKVKTQHHLANAINVSSRHFQATRAYNGGDLLAGLKQIPSYEDLFGSLNYVDCPECASIFGPGAYFYDLMRITDRYVTLENTTIPAGNTLEDRRPDLFNVIKLGCDDTETIVPYLQIVIDVLLARLTKSGLPSPYQTLAVAVYPFNLPFHRPLTEIRTYLSNLRASLEGIYSIFEVDAAAVAREYLGLSIEEQTGIITSHDTVEALNPFYGYRDASDHTAELARAETFLARSGLNWDGLRALLYQNLDADELKNGVANNFYINKTGEKDAPPYMSIVVDKSDPKSPFERIDGLTTKRLDRMSRFIRLNANLGWDPANLDWAMATFGATDIDAALIRNLAKLRRLQVAANLPVDSLCALWSVIKTYGKVEAGKPQDLFDQVFNNPALLQGAKPSSTVPFDLASPMVWNPVGGGSPDALIRGRLLGALGVTDTDLTLVADYVRCLLTKDGVEPATLTMDAPTLSLLYRLTAIPATLDIPVSEYLYLLKVLYAPKSKCADHSMDGSVRTVDDALTEFQTAKWMLGAGFTAYELHYLITGVPNEFVKLGHEDSEIPGFVASSAILVEPARVTPASFMYANIDAAQSKHIFDGLVGRFFNKDGIFLAAVPKYDDIAQQLAIADTGFATDDITAEQSQQAYSALKTQGFLIPIPLTASAALSATFNDRSPFTLTGFSKHQTNEVRAVLIQTLRDVDHTMDLLDADGKDPKAPAGLRSQQRQVAMQGLANFFDTTPEMLAATIPVVSVPTGLTEYLVALLTDPATNPYMGALKDFLALLARGLYLLRQLDFSATEAEGAIQHPAAFDIQSLITLGLADIRSLWMFKSLTTAFRDTDDALLAYLVSTETKDVRLQHLATLTGWNLQQIKTLVTFYWQDGDTWATVAGVATLKTAFDVSHASGLDASSLIALTGLANLPLLVAVDGKVEFSEKNWDMYETYSHSTLAAVNGKWRDAEFGDAYDDIRDALLMLKRDVLVGYTIWILNATDQTINKPSDLFQYFLMDVEMTSCDTVSRISQGIGSVQLYLQRCRMNLEFGVEKLPIPEAWWDWMSTYRIWEANREIFLYPENYLDPSLRRSRTPLFATLQQNLLQNDIAEETVSDAFRLYLDGFAELAQLRIVSAYHAKAEGSGTDTLFLFARTNTEPYRYYYRAVENYSIQTGASGATTQATWAAWIAIDLSISSPFVTPVYAFGRLNLFWVEQETTSNTRLQASGSATQQDNYTMTKASIKYAFVNFTNTWTPPQTLAKDLIISFTPNDAYLKAAKVPASSFDPDQLYWQKVYVVKGTHNAFGAGRSDDAGDDDQLLVLYGCNFPFSPAATISPIDPNSNQDYHQFPEQLVLNTQIFNAMTRAATMISAQDGPIGEAMMFPGWRVSASLLVEIDVPVLLDNWPTTTTLPTPYGGVLSKGDDAQTLSVVAGRNVEYIDYYDASYDFHRTSLSAFRPRALPPFERRTLPRESTGTAHVDAFDTVTLLNSAAEANTGIEPVKNQPGWFLFDNGDDMFLVASQEYPLRFISDIIRSFSNYGGWPIGWLYLFDLPFTDSGSVSGTYNFAFTRLSTYTVHQLSQALFAGGIPSLLSIQSQKAKELPFDRLDPTDRVTNTTTDDLDFNGAYGLYFWEVFFHSVFLIAESLRTNLRNEDAKTWYEYIFNPTASDGASYWKFLPLQSLTSESLEAILTNVAQIDAYNDDPFDPDAIARLRPTAYAKAIVMRYIDNLLDWADALFMQDTRESITQATNLYVLANDLLGPRPVDLGDFQKPTAKTFADIRAGFNLEGIAAAGTPNTITLDERAPTVSDSLNGLPVSITAGQGVGQQVTIIAYVGATRTATVAPDWNPPPALGSGYHVFSVPQFVMDLENAQGSVGAPAVAYADVPFNDLPFYFCVPENAELVAYWDRVEDRLYKIRHCMNMQGVERPLAQFAPPIDPRALVRAAGSGSAGPLVEGILEPPVPFYRFSTVLQQAMGMTESVISLGGSLLAALEKMDAANLDLLRVSQEQAILNLTTQVKEDQIAQIQNATTALASSLDSANARVDYYKGLVTEDRSQTEKEGMSAMRTARDLNLAAGILRTLSSVGFAIPQFGSPFAMTYGGQQVGSVLAGVAAAIEIQSGVETYNSQSALTNAGFDRRLQDWKFQKKLAELDVQQIAAQQAAASYQLRTAQRDLVIHEKTIQQNQEMEDFLKRRFTDAELYQWMVARLATVYFQSYRMAYDLARSAQRAFQYELNSDQTFINFGYWDNLWKGLLAGEGLMMSLQQMQAAYTNQASRPLEIVRTVSLLQLNAKALIDLKSKGECTFELSERLFDQDYPGHYARKIKTVSVSIPAVIGPYQNIKATLTQLTNQIVLTPDLNTVKYLLALDTQTTPSAKNLRSNWWVSQQVAFSSGVNDSGMFQLDFQSERYLPFEGTGAVSTWRLSLPKAANRFDVMSIPDVIFEIRYIARDGGKLFREQVAALSPVTNYDGGRFFSLSQQFSSAWYAFIQDHGDVTKQTLTVPIGAHIAPPQVTVDKLTFSRVGLQVAGDVAVPGDFISLTVATQSPLPVTIAAENVSPKMTENLTDFAGTWSIAFDLKKTPKELLGDDGFLDPKKLQDVALILYYTGTLTW